MKHISVSLRICLLLLVLADVVVDYVGKFQAAVEIAAIRIIGMGQNRCLRQSYILLRFFFVIEKMAPEPVRVAWVAVCKENRRSIFLKLRFATATGALAYASFPQDQQIKSNFNQANP